MIACGPRRSKTTPPVYVPPPGPRLGSRVTRRALVALLLALVPASVLAQAAVFRGALIDSTTRSPVAPARVVLTAEIRLSASDLLDRNKNTRRTINETYIEDARNETLGRYILLAFTYTMK